MKITRDYFKNKDVLFLAEDLIGKYLFTFFNGQITGGIITETEAYKGITDKASHAYKGKRTKRNEAMYDRGGVLYVYLCYGIHFLTNIVTNDKDIPDAILLRAIYPTHGEELMLKRLQKNRMHPHLLNGPGKLSKALGINLNANQLPLPSREVWLEDRALQIATQTIQKTPRIGIDYAEEDRLLPYRFVIKSSHIEEIIG